MNNIEFAQMKTIVLAAAKAQGKLSFVGDKLNATGKLTFNQYTFTFTSSTIWFDNTVGERFACNASHHSRQKLILEAINN